MSISYAVGRSLPRLSPAVAIAGAALAALVAVIASRLVSPALITAGGLGIIALVSVRVNLQTALLSLAFGRAALEGTYLLPAANVGGLALGLGDILTLAFFGGVLWYLAGRARAGTLTHLWRAPAVVPMLVFLGVAGFSLLYSADAIQGARDILKLASAFSVYLLLVADPPDARRLRLLLIGITVGSIVPILAGIGLLLTGASEVNEFKGWSRVQSIFVDPNAYGIYLVTVLAAAWALRGQLSGRARSWLDVLSLAAFVSVFLTLSRNAVAALAILVLVIGMRHHKVLIAAVGLTVIVLLASPQVAGRATQILSPESRTEWELGRGAKVTRTALVGRVEIWQEGLRLWRQRPFLGIGFGGISAAVGNNAHNDYLRSLVESGLVGFASFLIVIVSIIRLGRRAGSGRSDAPRVLMGLALGYVLVSYFANSLGKNVFQFNFWLLAGILYVWAQTNPINRPSSERVSRSEAGPLQLGVRLHDGSIVEGFARSDKLSGGGPLPLTSVTHTFDSEMNEIAVTPQDALLGSQVADVEIIGDSTTAFTAAGNDLRLQEPELILDDGGTLHLRLFNSRGELSDTKDRAVGSLVGSKGSAMASMADAKDTIGSSISEASPSTVNIRHGMKKKTAGLAKENPWGFALGAVAVGFLAGTLIRSTKVEKEKAGPVTDQIEKKVKETGQEAFERGKQVVESLPQAAQEAKLSDLEETDRRADHLSSPKDANPAKI